jgi:hypothetical protein
VTTENRFKRALTAPAKERPVLDLVASGGEAVSDILMKDELFAAVPVFSTAFKAMKALDSMRDRMFVAKLVAFVSEVDAAPPVVREEIARKLAEENDGRKAGETLLLVLEKLTDMDKPALLGALLVHYGHGRVSAVELRRLVSAVDVAFGDDLAAFLDESPESIQTGGNQAHREVLMPAGLTRLVVGETIKALGSAHFQSTELGELLHRLGGAGRFP